MKPYIKRAVKKLVFYPFILIFCYSVVSYRFMVDIVDPDSENYSPGLTVFSDVILSLQGFFTAVVFWGGNKSIGFLLKLRIFNNWYALFFIIMFVFVFYAARLWDYSKWYCCFCWPFGLCCDFSNITPFGQEPPFNPECGIVRLYIIKI